MSVWYVSSAAYLALPQFATGHTYSIGDIVRPLAAASVGQKPSFRCTVGGVSAGSESAWSTGANQTTTQGGATFVSTAASDTHGWTQPIGDLQTATGFNSSYASPGDTIYISSDHSESSSTPSYFNNMATTWTATLLLISVNRAGSTPPVAADITSGATLTSSSGAMSIDPKCQVFIEGVTFVVTTGNLNLSNGNARCAYFKNCTIQINQNSANAKIANSGNISVVWDNTTVQFANTGSGIQSNSFASDLLWINTLSAIQGATIPTTLFQQGGTDGLVTTCRGVDLSAITGTLVGTSASTCGLKVLLDSCKIASGVSVLGTNQFGNGDIVELVNCWDGTNIRNERYAVGGSVVTERTITLSGANGAQDDVGNYSLKFVSLATGVDKWAYPLEGFVLDVDNTLVGSSRTATVEIISSASLNNDDISLMLEYMGTAGSQIASFAWSLPTTPLTSNAAVASSSATWNSSPSTPVLQKLQVTFTPQVAGRVRGTVRLGKISTTVYVNPVIAIS